MWRMSSCGWYSRRLWRSCPAPRLGADRPGVNRQQVQLVARRFELRVDDNSTSRARKPSPEAEEAEGEARRNLEAGDEDVAALVEGLLDALLDARAVRDVHEIGKHALATLARRAQRKPRAPSRPPGAAARLDDDREGGQHVLRVVHGDDDGRGLAGEDVVGEARRDRRGRAGLRGPP